MSRYYIFDAIQAAKVVLSMKGDKLNVLPSSNVTPALAEFIRTNKAELVDMLERGQDLPPCERCQGPQWAVRTFDGFENFECQQCGVSSGCRRLPAKTPKETGRGKKTATPDVVVFNPNTVTAYREGVAA